MGTVYVCVRACARALTLLLYKYKERPHQHPSTRSPAHLRTTLHSNLSLIKIEKRDIMVTSKLWLISNCARGAPTLVSNQRRACASFRRAWDYMTNYLRAQRRLSLIGIKRIWHWKQNSLKPWQCLAPKGEGSSLRGNPRYKHISLRRKAASEGSFRPMSLIPLASRFAELWLLLNAGKWHTPVGSPPLNAFLCYT